MQGRAEVSPLLAMTDNIFLRLTWHCEGAIKTLNEHSKNNFGLSLHILKSYLSVEKASVCFACTLLRARSAAAGFKARVDTVLCCFKQDNVVLVYLRLIFRDSQIGVVRGVYICVFGKSELFFVAVDVNIFN